MTFSASQPTEVSGKSTFLFWEEGSLLTTTGNKVRSIKQAALKWKLGISSMSQFVFFSPK